MVIRMTNIANKKSTYNYEAQKKYNAKNNFVNLKFVQTENDFFECIENACLTLGMSKQGFIKAAIREKLERDGYL